MCTPEAQIWVRFALRPDAFEIKIVENRKCTEWPQNDHKTLTVKSTLNTLSTHRQGPNFGPFRSTVSRFPTASCFQHIAHFIIPYWCQKIKIWNFTILLTKFNVVETLRRSTHEFGVFVQRRSHLRFVLQYGPMLTKMKKNWQKSNSPPPPPSGEYFGSESDMYFHMRCRLKLLLPYGPMLTETEKIRNWKVWKKLVWRYGAEVVFPANVALIRFTVSGKTSFTESWWTTDGHTTDDSNSAVQ